MTDATVISFYEPEVSPHRMSTESTETVSLRKQLSQWCRVNAPTAQIMTITPELAALMLERNPSHNRPRNQFVVGDYKREMDSQNMMLTNQGIGFDTNGRLVDGQHRLMACVASNHQFESVVVFGLDPKAFLFVDSGYKRTAGQKLCIAGFPSGSHLAAAARIVLLYDLVDIALPISGSLGVQDKARTTVSSVPSEWILEFCQENPKFVDLRLWYPTYKKFSPISLTTFHAAHWIIQQKHPKLANAFIEQLALGEGLNRTENVYRLRDHLVSLSLSREKISKAWQLCWIIDAFNDTRRGKTTRFQMVAGRDFPKVLS